MLATTDELTGLFNRRYAMLRLSEHWSMACRYNQALSCAMIDIDRFKQLNDERGHAFGDSVLKQVAAVLQASLRDTDGGYRIGGDEFMVLLPHQSASESLHWADRFRDAVATQGASAALGAAVTVSIGIQERSPTIVTWQHLLASADKRLYAAKREGRNCVYAARH